MGDKMDFLKLNLTETRNMFFFGDGRQTQLDSN